jgi:hypothetical protein
MAANCRDEYPNGYNYVDGVPIVDVITSGVRLAEVLISLKKKGLAWISRSGMYKSPSEELFERHQAEFPYHGSGCWRL